MAVSFGLTLWLSALVIFPAVVFHRLYPDALPQLVAQTPWLHSAVLRVERLVKGSGAVKSDGLVFSPGELSKYDGREGSRGLYIAIVGRVYDVEKGRNFYGPDGGYKQFAGRDATRSFVTGDFEAKGLIDDVTGLTDKDLLALDNWVKFYEKDYTYVGKLTGRFYDEDGQPTSELLQFKAAVARELQKEEEEEAERAKFPGCNSEWADKKGGQVWCSTRSGGIERDWVGVPRRLFDPATGETRCTCVHPSRLDNPNLREYANCSPTSEACPLPMDDS